jgi:azurin
MVRRHVSWMALAACVGLAAPVRAAAGGQDAGPVRILLDQPARMVDYQISRLTPDELTRVERRVDDPRSRPIFVALLARKGIAGPYRDEALAALVAMDQTTPVRVLLDGLGRVAAGDDPTADKLLSMLLGQPVAALKRDREAFTQAVDQDRPALVLRGAYGGLLLADGAVDPAWALAQAHPGQLVELLRAVAHLPAAADPLRGQLFTPIAGVIDASVDSTLRAEALDAIGGTRRDATTFALLAREIAGGGDTGVRAAAMRSMLRLPQTVWPADRLEPVAQAVVAFVKAIPADRRTEPQAIDALQLGDRLAAALPEPARRTLRRDLRALGVQVVRLETIVEEMSFDQWWFAVEAGKPVQIVFSNREAMPHNLVIGQPGSLQDIGTAAAAVPVPTDPTVKPYVPNSPLVLRATFLLKEGETERLNFLAPRTPGEYVFLCSFPGHWVRMYGVMLVVDDLETWEAAPRAPTDPMTKQPFLSQRH